MNMISLDHCSKGWSHRAPEHRFNIAALHCSSTLYAPLCTLYMHIASKIEHHAALHKIIVKIVLDLSVFYNAVVARFALQ